MLSMFNDGSNNDNKNAEKSKKHQRLAFHNQIYKIQFGEHTINFIIVITMI